MSPKTVDRLQYPPIHDQHTKPLPEPSSQRSQTKSSPNRFTLLSSVSIGSGIPSFKNFGRKPSISTFASASSPHLPDLPITANEPLTTATFEDEASVLDHGVQEPLSRRTTIRTQASASEFGTGPTTLFAQSGMRMSRFFPFLRIDPAATSLTRSASPVPSSSVSTRHTSILPSYHSPSVYNYAVPFNKLGTASIVTPDTMSLASHRASVISTQMPSNTPEKKRPSNLALFNRLPQRKTTLFGPRSPSSLRATSLRNGGVQTTTSPLSLTQEVATLFPSPSPEDDTQSPPSSESPRSSRPFAGPRPRPAGSSKSTTASLTATSPQSLPDNESGSPPLSPRRPLPFVPQEPSPPPPPPTPKPKKRRSLISRLSGLGRSSSRSRSVEAQRLEELSFSADDDTPPVPPLPETTSESSQQQQQQRSLPFIPPQHNHIHSPDPSSTNSESKSNIGATPSIRRKLPDPAAVPAADQVAGTPTQSQSQTSTLFDGTHSKRIRPPLPLPPIPNSEDTSLTS